MRTNQKSGDKYKAVKKMGNRINTNTCVGGSKKVDINFLSAFAFLITGEQVQLSNPTNYYDDIDSIFHALVSHDNEHKLLRLCIPDVAKGVQKPVLKMLWQFIQIHWKTIAPGSSREMKVAEAIFRWCSEALAKYQSEVPPITDFVSSWRDGMALNCLIKSYDDTLIDLDEISKMRGEDRLAKALDLAKSHFNVSKLISPRDFQSEHLNEKSIICYLSSLYLGMVHQQKVDRFIQKKRESLATSASSSAGASSDQQHKHHKRHAKQSPSKTNTPSPRSTTGVTAIGGESTTNKEGSPSLTTSARSSLHSQHLANSHSASPKPSPLAMKSVTRAEFTEQQPIREAQQPSQPNVNPVKSEIDVEQEFSNMSSHDNPSEQIRSRSSSNSCPSSNKQSAKYETAIKEFEEWLKQAMKWLSEAEQELAKTNLTELDVEQLEIESIKGQFQEHEEFLLSLTQSQESVGKVLHRGQQLRQKVDAEQKEIIGKQLQVVNERWDKVRQKAMEKQHELQHKLDQIQIQRSHINRISEWLTEFETIVAHSGPISMNPARSLEQIAMHTQMQEQIELQEPSIQHLSSFVAVLDPSDDSSRGDQKNSLSQLEMKLQSIGTRWSSICEWAEKRAKSLDGIVGLLEQYDISREHLTLWLEARQNDMQQLRSVNHLESESDIEKQMHLIREMEKELSKEQPSFVELSRQSTELAQRFQLGGNLKAVESIHKQLGCITQDWENIVMRLEEQWGMLVRTGKMAPLEKSRRSSSLRGDSDMEDQSVPEKTHNNGRLNSTSTSDYVERKLSSESQKRSADKALLSDGNKRQHMEKQNSATKAIDEQALVKEFLRRVDDLELLIQALLRWGQSRSGMEEEKFQKQTPRQKAIICQAKLEEIKNAEKNVTQLQLRLDQMHNLGVNNLHRVRERFDNFMEKWSRVVAKISQMLASLTTTPKSSSNKNPLKNTSKTEHEHILDRVEEWLKNAIKIIEELKTVEPESERKKRTIQIAQQLGEHQTYVSYLKRSSSQSDSNVQIKITKIEKEFQKLILKLEDLNKIAGSRSPSTTRVQMFNRESLKSFDQPLITEKGSLTSDQQNSAKELNKDGQILQDAESQHWIEWLNKIEVQLTQIGQCGECFPGDLKRLGTELHLCDQIILELREKLNDLPAESSAPVTELMRPPIEQLLKAAEAQRDCCVSCINKTEQAIHKCVKVEDIADKYKRELDWILSNTSNIPLKEAEQKLQNIRESLDGELIIKANGIRAVQDLIKMAEKSNEGSSVCEKLTSRIQNLDAQWAGLDRDLNESILKARNERRRLAGNWIRTRKELLDEIGGELKAGTDTTDAEELSEQLDNLERAMDRLKSVEREGDTEGYTELIQMLVPDDRDLGELLTAVEQASGLLVPTVRTKCEKLRKAVEKCDKLEQTLCQFQSWCLQMLRIVGLRQPLVDITAFDIAAEYKQAYLSGTLINLMEKEIAEHECLVAELNEFLESNKPSDDRLHLELEHATRQMNELKTKFEVFKPPIILSQKIRDCNQRINEIENSIDDIATIMDSNCELCLQHVKHCQKQAEDIANSCARLETEKDLSIRRGMFSEQEAVDITSKINDLQHKCLTVAHQASETVSRLTRASELLKKFNKEFNEANKCITNAEKLSSEQSDGRTSSEELLNSIKSGIKAVTNARELKRLLRQDCIQISNEKVQEFSIIEVKLLDLERIFFAAEAKDSEEKAVKDKKANKQAGNLVHSILTTSNEDYVATVYELLEAFKSARRQLDFENFPVLSIQEWGERVKSVNNFEEIYKLQFDVILAEGKRVVTSGLGELDSHHHQSLAALDELIDLVKILDDELDANEKQVAKAKRTQADLAMGVGKLDEFVRQFESNLSDLSRSSSSWNSSAQLLNQAKSQLNMLCVLKEEFINNVPDCLKFDEDDSDKLADISKRIQQLENGLRTALGTSDQSMMEQQEKGSISSGIQLAMDAGFTTDDGETAKGNETEAELQMSCSTQPSVFKRLLESNSLEQYLLNLDTMEEHLELLKREQLPYEGIDEKLEVLQDFEVEINRGERLVQSQQMIMGIEESEHILQRNISLRAQINAKRHELENRVQKLSAISTLFSQCEDMITNLGAKFQAFKKVDRQRKSPDFDEMESSQQTLEQQLPEIAVRVQQCQNRLDSLSQQLSASVRDSMEKRMQQISVDFNAYTKLVVEERQRLEDRLADKAHLSHQIEMLEFWCDETESILTTSVQGSALEVDSLNEFVQTLQQRNSEIPEKFEALRLLEQLKDKFVALKSVQTEVKHEIRRTVSQLGKRLNDLKLDLNKKLQSFNEESNEARQFWDEFTAIEEWVNNSKKQINSFKEAKIYRPSLVGIAKISNELGENLQALQALKYQSSENSPEKMSENGKENFKRITSLLKEFSPLNSHVNSLLSHANGAPQGFVDADSFAEFNEQHQFEQRLYDNFEPSDSASRSSRGDQADLNVEFGSLHSQSDQDETQNGHHHPHRVKLEDRAKLDTVTRLRSWVSEVQRDLAFSVDISDQNIIRQAINKIQNWIDEAKMQNVKIMQIVDTTCDRLVLGRAQMCCEEMAKIIDKCIERKNTLQSLLEQTRIWDQMRILIEVWINNTSEKIFSKESAASLSSEVIHEHLNTIYAMLKQLDDYKEKMEAFNERSNEILDTFRFDDGHNFSHLTSRLNTQWTKFNEKLNIWRANFEVAIRLRQDFQVLLDQFEQWLKKKLNELAKMEKNTANKQHLKKTSQRRIWLAEIGELQAEIGAHMEMMETIRRMGEQLLDNNNNLDESKNIDNEPSNVNLELRNRLESVRDAWQQLSDVASTVRERLQSAQEECERLTATLSDLLFWSEQQIKVIANAQPVAGDISAIRKQCDVIRDIQDAMELQDPKVQNSIQLAHTFLMQHDLRPQLSSVMRLEDEKAVAPSETDREERRLGLQILSDSNKLQMLWEKLKEDAGNWSEVVKSAYRDMQELDKTIAETILSLEKVEDELFEFQPVEDLRLDELKEARIEVEELRKRLHDTRVTLDDVNDISGQISAKGINPNGRLNMTLYGVNKRFAKLSNDIGCRCAALERAFHDFGPASENFLTDVVDPPWQRAVASNRLPFYINHSTQKTQWDHPGMIDMLEQLGTFNQVKFSAYRTAMKLRALQKRLYLDLIDLADLDKCFEKQFNDYKNEAGEHLRVEDAIQCLIPLFESIHNRHPNLLKNVSLAVDLALNLVLNIYDSCRDSKMRVLSFKVALVVLCKMDIESKYKYLFNLVSTNEGVNHKQLAILFYDLIHIPKFIGEAAAFGGSNIEPSVRSCFELARFPTSIQIENFLEWLRKEPQSLVWLPVMHRIASSEFAKHSAKCNICKMFPIVGLRYRCLRCFNFDICQNCFFSQRTAKSHKLNHPMQEYCLPTDVRDDVRDFTKIVKNKMRRSQSRTGYLPVDQLAEGPPLEQVDIAPRNPDSESMHHRIQLFASRMEQHDRETIGAPIRAAVDNFEKQSETTPSNGKLEMKPNERRFGDNIVVNSLPNVAENAKSSSSLIASVEQMRKEELDQLLQKLKYENIELKKAIEERRHVLGASRLQYSEQRQNGSGFQKQLTSQRSYDQSLPRYLSSHPTEHPFSQHRVNRQEMFNRRISRSEDQLIGIDAYGSRNLSTDPEHQHQQDLRVLAESYQLKIHQQRLEQRSKILDEQNRQLQMQLHRLQNMIEKRKLGTVVQSSIEAAKREPFNGVVSSSEIDTDLECLGENYRDALASNGNYGLMATKIRKDRMHTLQNTANDISRALETFLGSIMVESPGGCSDESDADKDCDKAKTELTDD